MVNMQIVMFYLFKFANSQSHSYCNNSGEYFDPFHLLFFRRGQIRFWSSAVVNFNEKLKVYQYSPGSNNSSWLCSFSLQHQIQEKRLWLFYLKNSVILDQLLMFHVSIKVQKSRFFVEVSAMQVHGWCWRKIIKGAFLEAQKVHS